MHPALRNLEVIDIIISHTAHGTLPALASTCRIFQDPALDVLWRNLSSVETLISCMPGDLFTVEQGCMVLQKPPDDKMWDTLCKYTSRVRSIRQTYSSMSIEALGSILLSCPLAPRSLFPNLRKLTWRANGTRGAADFLRVAFVPTLLVLNVAVSSVSTSIAFLSVLSSLGTLCPRLQSLYMDYEPLTDHSYCKIIPFVIKPFSTLHHLRALQVWDIGDQGIQHIMQLRALQSLTLDLNSWSIGEKRSYLRLPGFHDLNYLGLHVNKLEDASKFFVSLEVVRSRDITVFFSPRSPPPASAMLSQFLGILQERCDNDKLERLSLVGYSKAVLTEPGVFTPLHAFRNLTQLNIQGSFSISMSDEQLCQLVRAWPRLKVLKISSWIVIDVATVLPTFHGLIGLLQLCPALTSLALVIDTTKLDGIDLRNPSGGRFNTLNCLTLGNSPIDCPVNVALILSGLFPRLEQVNIDCWNGYQLYVIPQRTPAMKQWASVNSILRGFSVVKERRVEA
ncbi:uncharacterized protein F5147DRAFT_771916 [Suillus discolor]|uniref:F-box domain-containing protein n=1 Tax=Suillus discolor TaxID=1912936 RepID=A0A9P7FAV0_9AGAM|nr:uncharacterized protein F5147DRAFT_771916 [Suillus discolor]KAG2111184.1 hypothetical protein F5147DRAFT_771916 [Suillus discolor]